MPGEGETSPPAPRAVPEASGQAKRGEAGTPGGREAPPKAGSRSQPTTARELGADARSGGGLGALGPRLVSVKDKVGKPAVRALRQPWFSDRVWALPGEYVDPITGEVVSLETFAAIEACYAGRWTQRAWRRADGRGVKLRPFLCRSWRCPKCRTWVRQRDFTRIRDALAQGEPSHVVMMVLTLDPDRVLSLEAAYRGLYEKWLRLRWLLRYNLTGSFKYVATIEAHRNGLPHMNVLAVSPELAMMLALEPPNEADRAAASNGTSRAPRWFRSFVRSAGFGYRCSLEHVESTDAAAAYVLKTSRDDTPRVVGEVIKTSQLPITSPKKTRRLRASHRFLKPARKVNPESEITGDVVFASEAEVRRWVGEPETPRPEP